MSNQTSLLVPPQLMATENEHLAVARDAAATAAEIVLQHHRKGVAIRAKESEPSYNLVTDADLQSEQAIASAIQNRFADHTILGEEEHDGEIDAHDLWIIDPLDGTNNFAHRIPHFAISIAYYRDGRPECGIVVNPARSDWYWAVKGQGAFHNGRKLQVDAAKTLREAIVACGFYYDRGALMESTLAAIHAFFKQEIHGIRRFGTAALDFCQVADGLFGAFFEYKLQPWDLAAGRLIVEEAGGKVTDGLGQPLQLKTTSVLVSNGWLHDDCLDIVAQHHPR